MVLAKIVDPATGEVLDTCTGPDPEGVCPREDEAGHVPCGGRLLEAVAPEVGWSLTMPVVSGTTTCPLRAFAVPSPDWDRWL